MIMSNQAKINISRKLTMLPVVFNEKMFDDLFDSDFFGGRNPLYGRHAKNLMKTDIREKEDGYEMAVDLPGFNKDEIKVEIKDGYMTVSANKDLDKDEADKKGRVIRRERYVGTCSRTFYVGDIKPEDVKAKYESGVLNIVLPKEEQKELPTASTVTIE